MSQNNFLHISLKRNSFVENDNLKHGNDIFLNVQTAHPYKMSPRLTKTISLQKVQPKPSSLSLQLLIPFVYNFEFVIVIIICN